MQWAWISMFTVCLTDLYIWLVSVRRVQRPAPHLLMAIEHHDYDVLVLGSGGSGLRAAIAAAEAGARTGLVCKSLLGKAHTVMAEGGLAASLGNVDPRTTGTRTSRTRCSAAST